MSDRKLSPAVQRIEKLVDENSFVELGAGITARSTDFNLNGKDTPGDGVVTGHATIDGNLVFIYSQDPSVLGGSIGEMHARKIANMYRMAVKTGAPVIGFLDCGGVRLEESYDALESIGSILSEALKASGVVPSIAAVMGKCGGGMAAIAGTADFVYMSENGRLFFNSPDAIPGNNKDENDTSAPAFQAGRTGIVDGSGTEDEIITEIRSLVSVIPGSSLEDGRYDVCNDDLNRASEDLAEKRLDPKEFAAEISDDHFFLETKKEYAKKSMTTGFIRLDGGTVGVVANREKCLKCGKEFGDDLTAEGLRKAAGFVRFCDAFGIPVLTLTNVKGYEKSTEAEADLPLAVADYLAALHEADVPKIDLITKHAEGTAYIVMNSKSAGADLVFAYPDAEMGIMNADDAARIIADGGSREEIQATRDAFEEKQSGIENALRRGYIDRVINFEDTRKYLIAGFEMLEEKSEDVPYRKHTTK